MFLRYWLVDGKATVIKNVDRLVWKSPDDFQYRRLVAGRYEWTCLKYGVDYLQFTFSKD